MLYFGNFVAVLNKEIGCTTFSGTVYPTNISPYTATLLSCTNIISVTEPLPNTLEDDYELSPGCGPLWNLRVERTYFRKIILNEETSLFMVTPPRIIYTDTHSNGALGAVIVKGSTLNLRPFCNCVWEMEAHLKRLTGIFIL